MHPAPSDISAISASTIRNHSGYDLLELELDGLGRHYPFKSGDQHAGLKTP